MTEDPRIVAALAALLLVWAAELELLPSDRTTETRNLARNALIDLELMGLRVVAVTNDLTQYAPPGAA